MSSIEHLPLKLSESEFIPLIPEGVYTFAYVQHETYLYFGRAAKATFWFRVTDYSEHFGKLIPRFYNAKRLKGKAGRNGNFVPSRSSDFIREYCNLFPEHISRLDRIPPSNFSKVSIKARVRTVTKDRKQRKLAEVLKYSVIDELIGVEH